MMDGVTAEEYQNLMLSVGTHQSKRRLSPVEVARLIEKYIASGNDADTLRDHAGDRIYAS